MKKKTNKKNFYLSKNNQNLLFFLKKLKFKDNRNKEELS